jgi:hypothetical protein
MLLFGPIVTVNFSITFKMSCMPSGAMMHEFGVETLIAKVH